MDITSKIINMVEEEYNAVKVKVLTNVHIDVFEVGIQIEDEEEGEKQARNLRITKTAIY